MSSDEITTGPLPALNLTINIGIVLSDFLAFAAVIHRLWGLWRLKQSLGLQSSNDLVTSIIRQGLLSLSSLLLCESTIDLRRRNAQKSAPNQSDFDLASFQNDPVRSIGIIFARFHESIMTEIGERIQIQNNSVDVQNACASASGVREAEDGFQDDVMQLEDRSEGRTEIIIE
ncbi:hypothetical protein Clacol_001112 [Clathrus columnatus]|uniref:Uncharacterized protein n=1 Tax=Clathrus columnatus TaxID=1419009 RepID=A0AAV4ZXN2_9AGAM|nr:hypothetical protein Clacol_001112 [Clathrus columnatus]